MRRASPRRRLALALLLASFGGCASLPSAAVLRADPRCRVWADTPGGAAAARVDGDQAWLQGPFGEVAAAYFAGPEAIAVRGALGPQTVGSLRDGALRLGSAFGEQLLDLRAEAGSTRLTLPLGPVRFESTPACSPRQVALGVVSLALASESPGGRPTPGGR